MPASASKIRSIERTELKTTCSQLPMLSQLTATYHDRGWCKIERCLDANTIQSFVDQLKRELRAPTVQGESGHDYRAIDLEESATWFRGTERRVVEVNPPGEGAHWARIERAPRLVVRTKCSPRHVGAAPERCGAHARVVLPHRLPRGPSLSYTDAARVVWRSDVARRLRRRLDE